MDSIDDIAGVETYDYPAGQEHVTTAVDYAESPPVGGPHAPPPDWADCTGTVYDVDIRHENAVHSLEHGAVWITYYPDALSQADIDTLAQLVENESGRMMSPYAGLDPPISIQAWGHQLKVDSADDKRIKQFADFLTLNNEFTPSRARAARTPASSPTRCLPAPRCRRRATPRPVGGHDHPRPLNRTTEADRDRRRPLPPP